MAIICDVIEPQYSLSGNIATLTVTLLLKDDTIVDENNEPKVLDQKTITIRQNVLDTNAMSILNQKLQNEISEYLQKAKVNIEQLDTLFGTHDPDEILASIHTNTQNLVNDLVSNIFSE